MQLTVSQDIGPLTLRPEGKRAIVELSGTILFIGSPLAAWAFALGWQARNTVGDGFQLKQINMTRETVPYTV